MVFLSNSVLGDACKIEVVKETHTIFGRNICLIAGDCHLVLRDLDAEKRAKLLSATTTLLGTIHGTRDHQT